MNSQTDSHLDVTHFKDLKKGQCVFLMPSHVQAMISGVQRIQQNSAGKITLTYEDGTTQSVQMGDLNLCAQDDFMKTFQAIWRRIETGA